MTRPAARPYRAVKPRIMRRVPEGLVDVRQRLVRVMAQKWVNGTVLHYAFRGGPEPQRRAVRSGFQEWLDLGIGLRFRVPATILIAIGGFIPGWTSGLNRFGITWSFFIGELLGVVFIFLGFLVSIVGGTLPLG